jgi:hypothetical protein
VVGGSRIAFTLKHLVLAVILLIVMFPVYWLVSMSVKSTRELSARPPTMIVQNFTLQNFYNVLVTQNFAQYAWNSVQVAVIATLIATVAGNWRSGVGPTGLASSVPLRRAHRSAHRVSPCHPEEARRRIQSIRPTT